MNIEELNKRISIVNIEITQDDESGFPEEKEVIYSSVWAKIANVSGNEVFKAGSDYSKVITKFVVRFSKSKTYTTDMKIRYGGKAPVGEETDTRTLYNIIYVNNFNESNEYIELTGEAVT